MRDNSTSMMLGRNRASSTHHLLEVNPTIRIVHSTSFPAGQGMTQGTSYLPTNIRHNLSAASTLNSRTPTQAALQPSQLSQAFTLSTTDCTIKEEEDSFETINSRNNGRSLAAKFPTFDDTFIPEDSTSDSITVPATPRRPDSPYPAASIASSARSTRSISSPRAPLPRLHSFTALPNIPPPIFEDAVSSTTATVSPNVHSANTVLSSSKTAQTVGGAPSTAEMRAAMRFAPGAKFKGGHFEAVKKGLLSQWIGCVVSTSSCGRRSDDWSCSECGWEWKEQSYGKRCGSGAHFQDGEGRMYKFVGEKFLFEEEEEEEKKEERGGEKVEGCVW